MTGKHEDNFTDSALDHFSGVEGLKNSFRGPTLQGWASFGWQALAPSAPPTRPRSTVTKMFHRPRRIR
jgi:hypothetical protein